MYGCQEKNFPFAEGEHATRVSFRSCSRAMGTGGKRRKFGRINRAVRTAGLNLIIQIRPISESGGRLPSVR